MPAKVEYPPLFPAGFVPMTLDEVRLVCVKDFPLSRTRSDIMNGLEEIVGRLENADVNGVLWIDGSFTTKKIDPEDVDILLCVDASLYDAGTPELKGAIDQLDQHLVKASHHCDSYVLREYPTGHPLANEAVWDRAYWHRQFGFSRQYEYKGIVTITIKAITDSGKAGDPYALLALMARWSA
jgi:hypothetical protein